MDPNGREIYRSHHDPFAMYPGLELPGPNGPGTDLKERKRSL